MHNSDILLTLIQERQPDLLILCEAAKLDSDSFLSSLAALGEEWKPLELCPKGDIRFFARASLNASIHEEESRNSSCILHCRGSEILVHALHLKSRTNNSIGSLSSDAQLIAEKLADIERNFFCGVNPEKYKTLVVGDFNLQPYDRGIAGINAFNATMSEEKATQLDRKRDKKKNLFYFNPTWALMGRHGRVQGSYYYSGDSDGLSIFWYSFDALLLRPSLIPAFTWSTFDYLTQIGNISLLTENHIINKTYSDHLPLLFELQEDAL